MQASDTLSRPLQSAITVWERTSGPDVNERVLPRLPTLPSGQVYEAGRVGNSGSTVAYRVSGTDAFYLVSESASQRRVQGPFHGLEQTNNPGMLDAFTSALDLLPPPHREAWPRK